MFYSYVKLGIAALLPVILSLVLHFIERGKAFSRISQKAWQVICGVAFGILAIIGTEFGVSINGAMMNARDAAVLCAGLLFGGPAGIIAGLIGGIERWIAVAWGVGSYTRVACSISTALAGFYAALLRKNMFDDKKPNWGISMAVGVVMEVFHLSMVFFTNMSDPLTAMRVVKVCTVPMILANGLSVMLASMALGIVSRELGAKNGKDSVRISQTIQKWLFVTVILAFFATSYFVFSLQTRLAEADIQETLDEAVADVERTIGTSAEDLLVGESGFVTISEAKPGDEVGAGEVVSIMRGDVACFKEHVVYNGLLIEVFLPSSEALQKRNIALYVNTFMEILVFAILFSLVYMLIKRVVVDQIEKVNASLGRITQGNLDETVNVRSNKEFASLSDDINSTVDTLKHYIADAAARIDSELQFAREIQTSALPDVAGLFGSAKDFDVFACMDTAKEVGGDFYDCYVTNGNILHFLVADVSGKGIPAAMFMMRAKTELKSLTEAGLPIGDVFTRGNDALCDGNEAGMFVTAWQGDINLNDGKLSFVNAGHNPPVIKHADGSFSFLKARSGLVLAGMEGMKYKAQELQLQSGDIVFLYTDGVTEADDGTGALFGEQRLLDVLNSREFSSMKELCEHVRSCVDSFVGDAPQFDDITMLAFRYIGAPSITVQNATLDDVPRVTEFIESKLREIPACTQKTIIQMNVAIDEVFSNIVNHGYAGTSGPVTVTFKEKQEPHTLFVKFEDEGIPYNPLTKEDPDITLSASERGIGGLGIFMVRKTMDDMKYRYENGKNILTITKRLDK